MSYHYVRASFIGRSTHVSNIAERLLRSAGEQFALVRTCEHRSESAIHDEVDVILVSGRIDEIRELVKGVRQLSKTVGVVALLSEPESETHLATLFLDGIDGFLCWHFDIPDLFSLVEQVAKRDALAAAL